MNKPSTFGRFGRVLSTYAERVGSFQPNARYYLISAILTGAALGVFRLLFNFYVLSQGYDEALLGTLITTNSLTALLAALPMGYLVDIIGRKIALILGGLAITAAIFGMVLLPSTAMFIAMSVVLGLGNALTGVTMGPFLMENSSEKERTYLFSFASGLQMAAGSVGNWVGGYLPTWMAALNGTTPTSPQSYAWSLGVIAAAGAVGVLPLFLMRMPKLARSERSLFAPLSYFKDHSALLGRLVLPMLIISVGAGLVMPFMNVFFRQVHNQPDQVIGTMFAWGSLAMGVGLLIAPPLADKYGKIQVVVVTQALSIPFLAVLGFSPWFALSAGAYFIRLALMNMSGPVYSTFIMERVEPSARGTVASLANMSNSVGWAFSPTISGLLQVRYGFQPVFAVTLVLYVISIYLYWRFFWRGAQTRG